MKTARLEYECDWCHVTTKVELDQEHITKHEIPPGWGVLLFTVRPFDPNVPDWSKHKYHACSRACATALVDKKYPRSAAFTEA